MEVLSHFEAEQFGTELVDLLKAWQAEWCASGPSTLRSPGEYAAFGTPGRWLEEANQRQSYENMLNYVSTAIAVANQYEETELILKAFKRYWGEFAGGSHNDNLYIRVLNDVFARTLQIIRQQVNTGQDRNITALMENQRTQLQKTLTFGYLKAKSKT